MIFKKKKNPPPTRPTLTYEEQSQALWTIMEDLRNKNCELVDENVDLGKLLVNKAKNLLVAMSVYSFVVTLLAIKSHPAFFADLLECGTTIKELVVSLFKLAMSLSSFLGGIINMIPVSVIAAILNILVVVAIFVGAAFIVLFVFMSIFFFFFMNYGYNFHDSISVGFLLFTLVPCVFFAEKICAIVPVNLVVLFVVVNVAYIIVRKLIDKWSGKTANSVLEPEEQETKEGNK